MGDSSGYNFFNSSFSMANNKYDNWLEYQQRPRNRMAFYYPGFHMQLPYLKRITEMAQIKWTLILADFLGIPIYFLGIYDNINNVRSAVLFIVGLTYVMFRIYFYVIQRKQAVRDKEYELWHKQIDKEERINKLKNK